LVHPQLVEQAAQGEAPHPRRVAAAGLVLDQILLTTDPLPVDPRHNSKIDYGKLRERLRGILGL
jgi:hypothetical protein